MGLEGVYCCNNTVKVQKLIESFYSKFLVSIPHTMMMIKFLITFTQFYFVISYVSAILTIRTYICTLHETIVLWLPFYSCFSSTFFNCLTSKDIELL